MHYLDIFSVVTGTSGNPFPEFAGFIKYVLNPSC
jgi:hypothetical protein